MSVVEGIGDLRLVIHDPALGPGNGPKGEIDNHKSPIANPPNYSSKTYSKSKYDKTTKIMLNPAASLIQYP